MAIDRIQVRNRETGATAWLPPRALAHFPDFEPVDPPAAPVEPEPPAASAQPTPAPADKPRKRPAATTETTEEE
jgi:hypothetical protein